MTQGSALPAGWVQATIADTGGYVNGVALKPSDWGNQGRPIIRIQNLTDPARPFNRTNRKVGAVYNVCDGDIGKAHELFGEKLDAILAEMNEALVA